MPLGMQFCQGPTSRSGSRSDSAKGMSQHDEGSATNGSACLDFSPGEAWLGSRKNAQVGLSSHLFKEAARGWQTAPDVDVEGRDALEMTTINTVCNMTETIARGRHGGKESIWGDMERSSTVLSVLPGEHPVVRGTGGKRRKRRESRLMTSLRRENSSGDDDGSGQPKVSMEHFKFSKGLTPSGNSLPVTMDTRENLWQGSDKAPNWSPRSRRGSSRTGRFSSESDQAVDIDDFNAMLDGGPPVVDACFSCEVIPVDHHVAMSVSAAVPEVVSFCGWGADSDGGSDRLSSTSGEAVDIASYIASMASDHESCS